MRGARSCAWCRSHRQCHGCTWMGARDAPHRADGCLEGALVLGAGRCPKGGCYVSRMGCHNAPLGGGCVKDCCESCDVPRRNKCMQQFCTTGQLWGRTMTKGTGPCPHAPSEAGACSLEMAFAWS